MENLAVLHEQERPERERPVELLIADDDPGLRSLLASHARDAGDGLAVLEARDGAEAIQLGLQRRPQIALIDVNMPRIGGLEAAITLRELDPGMRLALYSADVPAHRERAHEHRLLLFDKLELDRAIGWLQLQVRGCSSSLRRRLRQKLTLECSVCGYGVTRATPPDRCPMCHSVDGWVHAAWRPFAGAARGG